MNTNDATTNYDDNSNFQKADHMLTSINNPNYRVNARIFWWDCSFFFSNCNWV